MKKYSIALFVCALLFLAGCGEGEDGLPEGGAPFLGGTTGIVANFENSPPAEVFDGGDFPFDIIVKLKNNGEWDIPKERVRVKLSGIRAQQFDLTEPELQKAAPEDLPKMQRDPTGALIESPPVLVEFNDFNHKDSVTGSELTYPLRADVCFNYGTIAVTQLCVRENILNPKLGGICVINEQKPVFNSGAPVQISSVTENARSSTKIGFTFTVQHVGTGSVYEQNTICNKASRAYENEVYVKVDAGVPGVSCSGLGGEGATEGSVKLFGGSKVVSCTLTLANPSDYKLPVTITLGYDYEVSQSSQILVKHAGG